MSERYWIGVDLGGTKILAGLFDANFQIVSKIKQATAGEQGAKAVFDRIIAACEELLKAASIQRTQVGGMGLGVPGQVDPRSGKVRYAPNLAWRDLDLSTMMPSDWNFSITAENDVKVGTWGEFTHGAAVGAQHVLGVFAGTGVGGGLILNGELFHGFNFNAGEIGHVVIHWRKGTSLEDIAGRRSMQARAGRLLSDAPKRVRREWKGVDVAGMKSSQLAKFYANDDPIAVRLVDDGARALGAAIGSVVNLISPEVIVMGGGVVGALGESFLERVWEIARRYTLPGAADGIKFTAAQLGDDSGIYGAAELARRKVGG